MTTVYLLYNEGYSASAGDSPLRRQLTAEAVRLAHLLLELLPDQVGVLGLTALLHLHEARAPARLDADGEPVRLPDQDRAGWDRGEIAAGLSWLGVALRQPAATPDPYVVQAAIAACHDLAPSWAETNWAAITSWYDVLSTLTDSPVVRLNRAVARSELYGPAVGLSELDEIHDLAEYLPFVAARAELLARVGRVHEAQVAFRSALALKGNDATKRDLSRRLAELS